MVDAVVLTLAGIERTWHFNNYALIELAKALKTTPDKAHSEVMKIAEDDVFMGLAVVIFAGLVGHEKSKFNLQHGITIENIAKLMGEVDTNEFTPMWDAFKRTMGISEFLNNLPESENTDKEKKKKQSGKKSTNSPLVK